MRKWIVEEWEFELTAIEGKAANCRLGIEKGDKFIFLTNVLQEFVRELCLNCLHGVK